MEVHRHVGVPEPGANEVGGAAGRWRRGEYAESTCWPLCGQHLRATVRVEWTRRQSRSLVQPGHGKLVN